MSPAMQHEISRVNRIFEEAVAARAIEQLDSVYTSDARILPPGGEMVSGRENIKSFWKGAIEGLNVASVELETLDFQAAGETGYEIGRGTLNFAAGTPSMHAKYVVVWKREDSSWRWHVDIWNANA